jgi:hypothetical protein
MNLLKDKITGMPRGVAFVRYFLFFFSVRFRKRVINDELNLPIEDTTSERRPKRPSST